MPSDKRTAALPPALIVWVLAVAGVAAAPGLAVGESLLAAAPQDSSVVERSLELQRSTRRLIQQGLRNEGFDPGTPDRLFGPRTRAPIREWQQSRGASSTGYLKGAEAELLQTAAAPRSAASEAPPPLEAVPAAAPTASSAAAASTSAETDSSPAPPATVAAEEVDQQNAVETNTQQRAPGADGTVRLPPEILVDRHLVRAERLLAAGDPDAAFAAINEILALQDEHDRHPVTCMSWDDAQAYMSWLRETTGARYRLQTYEELRGATVSPSECDSATFAGPLGICGCHSRHSTDRVAPGTCPVGTYGRNRLGLSDMLGNVAEWTSRCGGDCGRRLAHGGGWDSRPSNRRFTASTDYRHAGIGIRVARTLE